MISFISLMNDYLLMSEEQQVWIIIDRFCEYANINKLDLLRTERIGEPRISQHHYQIHTLISVLVDKGISGSSIARYLNRDPASIIKRIKRIDKDEIAKSKQRFTLWLLNNK